MYSSKYILCACLIEGDQTGIHIYVYTMHEITSIQLKYIQKIILMSEPDRVDQRFSQSDNASLTLNLSP